MTFSSNVRSARYAAAALLVTVSQTAWPGQFNHRLLSTGERASGLGGAFVALSDDETGMLYNPAGLVNTDRNAPSATVNLISGSRTKYDDVFGSLSWSRDSIGVVPSFFGVSTDIGDHWAIGGSLVVLDYSSEDQTDEFRDVTIGASTYDELRVHNDSSSKAYNFGLTLARGWPDSGLSVGFTGYLHYGERDRSFSQRLSNDADRSTIQDDTSILVDVRQDDEVFGFRPVLGIQYRNSAYSLGLAVSRLFEFQRDYFYAFTGTATTPDDSLSFDLIDDSDELEDQPLHISIGAAMFSAAKSTLSLQIDWFEARGVDRSDPPAGLPPRDIATKTIINFAAGYETLLSPEWTLRAGAYTDYANNRAERAAQFENREEIDVYGVTLSVSKKRKKGYWTLGFDVAHGNGKATLGDIGFGTTNGFEQVDASKSAFNLLLSTTW